MQAMQKYPINWPDRKSIILGAKYVSSVKKLNINMAGATKSPYPGNE